MPSCAEDAEGHRTHFFLLRSQSQNMGEGTFTDRLSLAAREHPGECVACLFKGLRRLWRFGPSHAPCPFLTRLFRCAENVTLRVDGPYGRPAYFDQSTYVTCLPCSCAAPGHIQRSSRHAPFSHRAATLSSSPAALVSRPCTRSCRRFTPGPRPGTPLATFKRWS